MKRSGARKGGGASRCGIAFVAVAAVAVFARSAGAQTPGTTAIASRATGGQQGDAPSSQPSSSADGRFVAFTSDAANLVPLDTNGNSDVFVHDAETGTTERVSVTWQGQEARDDSDCPSISADGRYVAFRSRAWNMYPGGANLGNPIWQAYVHDREGPSTVRVTVPISGLDPDGEVVDCPALSGNATHVAFSSSATNLIAGDENGVEDVFVKNLATGDVERPKFNPSAGEIDRANRNPTLSANGRIVAFESWASLTAPRIGVFDLETDEVTVVKAGPNDADAAWADARDPALSADGHLVAFRDQAGAPVDLAGARVFLYDLEAGEVIAAAPGRSQSDCMAAGLPFPCDRGLSTMPAISGDGRFVAFGTDSQLALPGNTNHGIQVYLYDRVTGRLRRLSVDATSEPGENCSLEPTLSADGRVVAYRSTSTNLVANDANGPAADVLRTEWTCNADGDCRTLSLCPKTPASCEAADASSLRIRRRPPGGKRQDRFHWRWSGAPEASGTPFVDPTGSGRYSLCLYAESPERVEFDAGVPSGAGWKSRRRGYRLDVEGDSLAAVKLGTTPGRTTVEVKGAGDLLDLPYLPLAAPNGIRVQLHESTTGRCWGADFPTTAIRANFRGSAGSGLGESGQVRAEVR
jgi:Tol biopolymer transport system component